MTNNDKIRYEKLKYDINKEAAQIFGNISDNHQVKLINMNMLYTKKYYLLIKK